MTGAAVYDLMFQNFSDEEVYELYNPYWSTLLKPWKVAGEEPAQTAARVTSEMAADWYGAADGLTQVALDDGQGGMWEYSEAERAYWMEMRSSVSEPIEYGYSGGWDNIVNCFAFLVFAILAVCVTLAPVFSFEYQSGADAVVLATKHGRTRLVAAKVLAALVYATAYFAACTAIVVGVSLAFYGADGFGISIQSIALSSPYPLTAGQAALLSIGLMYAACLGFACLTLALSSRIRSTLPVFVADVVLVLFTGLIPSAGVGALERALALFPLNFSNFTMLFSALESYPVGLVRARSYRDDPRRVRRSRDRRDPCRRRVVQAPSGVVTSRPRPASGGAGGVPLTTQSHLGLIAARMEQARWERGISVVELAAAWGSTASACGASSTGSAP